MGSSKLHGGDCTSGWTCYNSNMTEQELQEAHHKPLPFRMKHHLWSVRRRAYDDIYHCLDSQPSNEYRIGSENYSIGKLASILNGLVEEKHPNVLLRGLQNVEAMLRLGLAQGKQFNELTFEGLQKFPLVTQQRKAIGQKFLDILELCKVDSHTMSNRLALPQDKSVMFVIEVIGALNMHSLKGKLVTLSKKHPKASVKQLAAQIAAELEDVEVPVKVKKETTKSRVFEKKEETKDRRFDILDKMPQFEGLTPKDQQKYTESLLQIIEDVSHMSPSGSISNFSYYLHLMIEDNNQIISTNGIKILSSLVRNRSQLLPHSFPLLFLFRKFKMHKTHPTNSHISLLIQTILQSQRTNDLMNAICQGMGSMENKANLKYGCIVSFIRVFCYMHQQEDIFSRYCVGEYREEISEMVENRKYVEKMLAKGFEQFSKQKDKDYAVVIERMRQAMGMPFSSTAMSTQKSLKQINRRQGPSPMSRNKSTVDSHMKTQPIPKPSSVKKPKPSPVVVQYPEAELNKILDILDSGTFSESKLRKAMDGCLKCLKVNVAEQVYDLFFYCQILESFIDRYQPDDWAQDISEFLIQFLKILSNIQLRPGKKGSRIAQNGLQSLLRLSTCTLALSKELVTILNNVKTNFDYEMIIKCLGELLVMREETLKKKNKKYLIRWLEQNTPQECLNRQYDEILEAIQNQGSKSKKTPSIAQAPSVIDLPSTQHHTPTYKQGEYSSKYPMVQFKREQRQSSADYQAVSPLKANELHDDNYRILSPTKSDSNEESPEFREAEKNRRELEMQLLQNANISKIEQVEEASTDRLDERWQYFLNKKNITTAKESKQEAPQTHTRVHQRQESQEEEEKYNAADSHLSYSHQSESKRQEQEYYEVNSPTFNFQHSRKKSAQVGELEVKPALREEAEIAKFEEAEEQEEEESSHFREQKSQNKFSQPVSLQTSSSKTAADMPNEYRYLDSSKINYMLQNSNNPFNHLRSLILVPYKANPNKTTFLTELTHLLQNQTLPKPQPFNSVLLLVILLFTEIKSDRNVIEPLQYLYEFMAQHCTNNEFISIIISLYHSVIDQTQENDRKILLTILTKSLIRMMPFVEQPLQLLKDFQQFYQIGQMVYFDMFTEQYQQIRDVIENSECLEEVIDKAYKQEGEGLKAIVEGWLQTGFKEVVRQTLEKVECIQGEENDV